MYIYYLKIEMYTCEAKSTLENGNTIRTVTIFASKSAILPKKKSLLHICPHNLNKKNTPFFKLLPVQN